MCFPIDLGKYKQPVPINQQTTLGSFYWRELPASVNVMHPGINLCLPSETNPLSRVNISAHVQTCEILESLDKDSRRDCICLTGPSASGKTTTAFRIAAKRFALYIDGGEVSIYGTGWANVGGPYLDRETMRPILIDLWTRMVLLYMARLQGYADTPYQWLLFQISARGDHFSSVSMIAQTQTTGFLQDTLRSLFNAVPYLLEREQSLVVILDEAQSFANSSLYPINITNTRWSLLSHWLYYITIKWDLPIIPILVGTSFSISHEVSLVSAVRKPEISFKVFIITAFSLLHSNDIIKRLNDLIALDGIDKSILQKAYFLQGRPRFMTSLVHELLEHPEKNHLPTLEAKTQRFAEVMQQTYHKSIQSAIGELNRILSVHPTAVQDMITLCLHMMLHDLMIEEAPNIVNLPGLMYGIVPFVEHAPIVITTNRVSNSDQSNLLQITAKDFKEIGAFLQEPITMNALLATIPSKALIRSYIAKMITTCHDFSAFGRAFNSLILL
eukprot:TRINITY_DN559_c6_g1_i4.p1 TRINITY_DN559_c6_g1~~TRINITY_DN559_c6_g1_i4.p1  ORF type:complete len:500 (+),score=46.06 TRINITY_DN559_c6_g1_i4:1066-2565(+)